MNSSKPKRTFSDATETLCCCEYKNMKGEKSHVMAACCDCEALDETFDRIFKCERVPESTIDRLLNTISDRCRFPTCFGGGAVKLRPDVVAPIIVVPSCLCLSTLHPFMTVLCFLFMPVFIITFYALWRRKDRHRRTVFFYTWAITSVITCYLVFQFFVVAFREVLLWEILTVFTSMMFLFYLLYLIKRDPEELKIPFKARPGHRRTPSNIPLNESIQLYDQMSGEEVGHKLYNGDLSDVKVEGASGTETTTWIDTRSNTGKLDLPARAGYCKICDCYIAVRDHHCIWIDSCVGAPNHRQFILAMIVFVLTGLYGAHLTFTTVCTPKMYYDWFLLPNDCRWLYNDFITAISFVTAVYCIIVTALVSIGLLFQFILISQNITSHELAQAHRQGLTRCVIFARNNPNNQGFLRNWMEFWFLGSRTASVRPLT